jgi:hypothetical protein
MFKAAQTYSDGQVVTWDQDPGSGGQEPEHPAPTLRLVKAAAATAPRAASVTSPSSDDGTARLLGGLGLAAGIIGAGVGTYGLTRKRTS